MLNRVGWTVLVLATCVSSCASDEVTQSINGGTDPATLALASRGEVDSARHQLELELQEELEICMRSEGWQYQPVRETEEFEYASDFVEVVIEGRPDDGGIPTLGVAESLLFAWENDMLFSPPGISEESLANRDYARELDLPSQQAYAASLGRCYTKAGETVGSSELDRKIDLVERVRAEAWERTFASSTIEKLVFDWVDCVNGKGIEDVPPSPIAIRDLLAEEAILIVADLEDQQDRIPFALEEFGRRERALQEASTDCGADEAVSAILERYDEELDSAIAGL